MKKSLYLVAVIAGVAIAVLINILKRDAAPATGDDAAETVRGAIASVEPAAAAPNPGAPQEEQEAAQEEETEEKEELTPEEQAEREEEKLVEAFDALTDKWYEGEFSTKSVTMPDVDAFVAQFKTLPPARREECLQRALNLISDDHALLLVGLLLDREIEKEYVELVFNDVLNRDEDVKKPILHEIYKDRTHPNWADVAWIFDATGEETK